MKAPHHLWSTKDGRLVRTGDLDAEILAYPAGADLPDDVADKLGLVDQPLKRAVKPTDKARTKQADK